MADDRADERPPDEGDPRSTGLPGKVERWRRRSATGAIMSGFAFGLREVFEPERNEPSIMLETSGAPPEDLPVDAEFDPIASRRSVVKIRPWLLERTGGTEVPQPAQSTDQAKDGRPAVDDDDAPERR